MFVVFDLVEANLWLLTPRQFGCRVAQKYFQSDEMYMFAYSLFSALSKGPKASAHRVLDEIAQRKYFLAVYDLVLQRAHRGVPVDGIFFIFFLLLVLFTCFFFLACFSSHVRGPD